MIAVGLLFPEDELRALAQFVKRVGYEDVNRFAALCYTYDRGRSEGDVMWSAVCMLQRQLAEAGYSPR